MRSSIVSGLAVAASVVAMSPLAQAQEIWTGYDVTFSKGAGGHDTEAGQDRITDDVWITRLFQGLHNAAVESDYDKGTFLRPSGTEWAAGTTADWDTLTYDTWYNAVAGNPPGSVGQNYVLHLIDDDIYLDVRFTSWGVGPGAGGAFSYERSANPVPEPASLGLLLAGSGALLMRRRRQA